MGDDDKQGIVQGLKEFYTNNHQKLLFIPIILFIASVVIIFSFYLENGDIMEKDVTLKGGITTTIQTEQEINLNQLESTLRQQYGDATVRKLAEFGSDKQRGIIAEVATEQEQELKATLSQELNLELTEDIYSVEVMGSTLGASFYKQMVTAIAIAFLFMAIVIFIVFRSFTPSMAVVMAALGDIIITLAIINLLHIKVSTTGISAFLLLIGYSIDTDTLLTTRVIKRKEGSIIDRVFDSMKTGLTMTITTITALLAGTFISTSIAIQQMFIIIIIGLVIDVIMTYFMNAPILIRYTTKKEQ
jgi:preprotein translocase subunit SecF